MKPDGGATRNMQACRDEQTDRKARGSAAPSETVGAHAENLSPPD